MIYTVLRSNLNHFKFSMTNLRRRTETMMMTRMSSSLPIERLVMTRTMKMRASSRRISILMSLA